MSAYKKLAQNLEWQISDLDWIHEAYTNHLVERLAAYRNEDNSTSKEIDSLCQLLTPIEIKSFVAYPFVADILLPRTKFNSHEDYWPIQAYLLTYLSYLGKVSEEFSVINFPAGSFRPTNLSYPLLERDNHLLPTDYSCGVEFPGMDRGGNELDFLNENILKEESDRITYAQELIQKWNVNAWMLCTRGTELLSVRKEISEPDKFGSASFRGLAGLNLLINPHKTNMANIVEAILHEAIHCVLYQLEPPFGDFFTDKSKSKEPIKSPWTGTVITTDNIAQASYVWYGLFNFWLSAIPYSETDRAARNASQTAERIAKGFQNLELSNLEKILNPEMFAAISDMKKKIIKTTANIVYKQ